MRILAIDTALPAVSACVLDDDAEAPLASESIAMERGHAEALAPLIARVVGAVDGGFASLDRVAATVGPGSFTGIRIGLAAGQAVARARNIDVVGVSTLSALAAPRLFEHAEGVLAAAIDARHDHIYLAAFRSGGRLLISPRRASAREAVDSLRGLNDGSPLLLVGSGAPLLEREARAAGIKARVLDEAAAPDIAFVARLGLIANVAEAPARPLYLKSPDVTLPGGAPAPEA
jgi:tRNA threonylcarbamoyladenosine biosynthesis protein TsaB